MRLVIVPRWGGDASSDFYPWLRERVADEVDAVITSTLLPTPSLPEIEPSVADLLARLGDAGSDVLMMGHSVGNQVVMRALAERGGPPVVGCLLVAGWYAVDEPWNSLMPWVDTPIDDARVRAVAGEVRVLVSTNDRFTSNYGMTQRAFESRLGAAVRVVEGRDHFNGTKQPEVLEELRVLLRSRAS